MDNSLRVLGASNHSLTERAYLDYYGTNPYCVERLISVENFCSNIWECCSGHNLISNVLKNLNFNVYSTDIYDYGFQDDIIDFLNCSFKWNGDIITNPPYNFSLDFVLKSLSLIDHGRKVAMFLPLRFLEGQVRFNKLFSNFPPYKVLVFIKRQVCSKFDNFNEGSAIAYAWFIWIKGFKGNTIIEWL